HFRSCGHLAGHQYPAGCSPEYQDVQRGTSDDFHTLAHQQETPIEPRPCHLPRSSLLRTRDVCSEAVSSRCSLRTSMTISPQDCRNYRSCSTRSVPTQLPRSWGLLLPASTRRSCSSTSSSPLSKLCRRISTIRTDTELNRRSLWR